MMIEESRESCGTQTLNDYREKRQLITGGQEYQIIND